MIRLLGPGGCSFKNVRTNKSDPKSTFPFEKRPHLSLVLTEIYDKSIELFFITLYFRIFIIVVTHDFTSLFVHLFD